MSISNADKKKFRTIGHQLKPVVIIAQKGLTENIKEEIDRALKDHELIKVKLVTSTRQAKQKLTEEICADYKAECIQSVGHVILIHRAAKKPDPKLSNLLRKLS
ncbi:MAG: ribosome assembly RNA-binding protein YhbY [Pseudomonadales bacterium]|nr:ribosome assembly RNA-binding protein YhbY [Pseudomonadales bacterium]